MVQGNRKVRYSGQVGVAQEEENGRDADQA